MSRYLPTDEQYDAALTAAAHTHHKRILTSMQLGCAMTMRQIDQALGDYLQDEQAWAEIITKTIAGENPMQRVIAEVIWNEAEMAARRELAQRERERPQNIADDRAEQRAWDRLVAFENAYG